MRKKYLVLSLVALLIICVFTACSDDKAQEETVDATTEINTELNTEKTTEAETTTKPAPETTKKQEYVPVETTKKATTTKALETTKKQETKPVVNQNDDVEVKDKDREELPTYADGSFNMGAMEDDDPGEVGYF